MEDKLRQFIEKIHRLNRSHDGYTEFSNTTHRESLTLDLYKAASKLMAAHKNGNLAEQLNEVEAKLYVAQATNSIGSKDLDELLDILGEIREEIA